MAVAPITPATTGTPTTSATSTKTDTPATTTNTPTTTSTKTQQVVFLGDGFTAGSSGTSWASLVSDKLGWQATQGPEFEALLPLAQFTADERARAAALAGAPVPRLLHQVWIGSLPRPPALAAWRDWCAARGREYLLWDEAALAGIGAPDHPAYRAMLAAGDYPGAVDVARYLILQARGGIYLDADFHPNPGGGDFGDYLPAHGLSALAEDVPRVTGRGPVLLTNALIAAPAGHPVMAALLRIMPEAVRSLPRAPAWWVTGPLVFTLLARLCPLGMAAHDIVAGRLPRRAPPEALAQFRGQPGLLIDWKSW